MQVQQDLDVGARLALELLPQQVDAKVHQHAHAMLGHEGNRFSQGGIVPPPVPEVAPNAERCNQMALRLQLLGHPHVPVADAGEAAEVLVLEGFGHRRLDLHLLRQRERFAIVVGTVGALLRDVPVGVAPVVLALRKLAVRWEAEHHRSHHRMRVAALDRCNVVLIARQVGHDAGLGTLLVRIEHHVAGVGHEAGAGFLRNVLKVAADPEGMLAG